MMTKKVQIHPDFIDEIREIHHTREGAIKWILQLDNQCRALIRRALGWRITTPKKLRNEYNKKAQKIVDCLMQDTPDEETYRDLVENEVIPTELIFHINQLKPVIQYFQKTKARQTQALEQRVGDLPIMSFIEKTGGLGKVGVGIIIGEAGDLRNYASPAKLWKRLGLAPGWCYDSVTKSGRPCNRKPKVRRSRIFRIGAALICSGGTYYKLYKERRKKEDEKHPELPAAVRHYRAQRYMEKHLVKKLWTAWRAYIAPYSPEAKRAAGN